MPVVLVALNHHEEILLGERCPRPASRVRYEAPIVPAVIVDGRWCNDEDL